VEFSVKYLDIKIIISNKVDNQQPLVYPLISAKFNNLPTYKIKMKKGGLMAIVREVEWLTI